MAQDVVLGILTHSPKSRKTPGLSSWDILSRPWRDWNGLQILPRTDVLGYSQPSLRDSLLDRRVLTHPLKAVRFRKNEFFSSL